MHSGSRRAAWCWEAFLFKKIALGLAVVAVIGCNDNDFDEVIAAPSAPQAVVPADIEAVFSKPVYRDSIWGLRVLDSATGEVLLDTQPGRQFLIASVRKVFSVGLLLNETGPSRTYDTPVFRQGTVNGGVLTGNLVLVASGDLTMGGRTGPDGRIEITNYDHSEASGLGNAVLSSADPLAGYKSLARQVAASGITRITGEVVIDDRLFEPFEFREEFDVTPAFVNDNLVDLTINPTTVGSLASVDVRPLSAALTVVNALVTTAAGTEYDVDLQPELPVGIGTPGLTATVSGALPVDFAPPLTGVFPLVRTFRITSPTNYARTVFVEALEANGVQVDAATVEPNPVAVLPPRGTYQQSDRVALLVGSPVADIARYVLKVSYNIGADTSLVLFGLTQGVNNITAALIEEQKVLANLVGIDPSDYFFIDGSGGGETTATMAAVTTMLDFLLDSSTGPSFFAALPVLAVDGSLGSVTGFMADPTLAGAEGNVYAKTGTFVGGVNGKPVLRARALAGYIDARSGRRLTFMLVVNNVPFSGDIQEVFAVFQDQGVIAATLWRDY